jgi:hypothetical protein
MDAIGNIGSGIGAGIEAIGNIESGIGAGMEAIGTGINNFNTYMAIRNAARMSAQNQPIRDYEDAIEAIQVNRLVQAAYEQEQRAINAEQMMLKAREILRRDYESQTLVPYIPPSGGSSSYYRPPLQQSPTLNMPLPITLNSGTQSLPALFNIGTPPQTPPRSSASSSTSFQLTPELKRILNAEGSLPPRILAIQDVPLFPQGQGSGQNYVTKPQAKATRKLR